MALNLLVTLSIGIILYFPILQILIPLTIIDIVIELPIILLVGSP